MVEEEERANKALIDRMTRGGALIPANVTKSTWHQHVEILKMVKVNQNNARKKRNKKELEVILAEASACKKQRNE